MRYIVLLFAVFCLDVEGQSFSKDSLQKTILVFQKELNEQYRDSLDSPLKNEERIKFKEHLFYPFDAKYCVEAKLIKTPGENTFPMVTSSAKRPMYVKYGELHFKLNGKKLKLNVYQSMDLLNNPGYRDYLFLPFKDLTSGDETYGGGRFIDLTIPKGDKMLLDFNKAYNPYCAYTTGYSCPVPPAENFLDVKVRAGIKGPANH
jgi:uncharacterized protein